MTERISGIKLNIGKMTDGELLAVVDHQLERFYHAEKDLQTLLGYAATRGLVAPAPEGAEVISLDDYRQRAAQGTLFDMPDGAA